MNNTLRKIILAFCAERYPAAYTSNAISQRVNRSGFLDKQATHAEVLADLRLLSTRFSHVVLLVDPDGDQHWSATPDGVRAWQLDGALTIGG